MKNMKKTQFPVFYTKNGNLAVVRRYNIKQNTVSCRTRQGKFILSFDKAREAFEDKNHLPSVPTDIKWSESNTDLIKVVFDKFNFNSTDSGFVDAKIYPYNKRVKIKFQYGKAISKDFAKEVLLSSILAHKHCEIMDGDRFCDTIESGVLYFDKEMIEYQSCLYLMS